MFSGGGILQNLEHDLKALAKGLSRKRINDGCGLRPKQDVCTIPSEAQGTSQKRRKETFKSQERGRRAVESQSPEST